MRVFLPCYILILLMYYSCALTDKIDSVQKEKIIDQEECGPEDSQAIVIGVNVLGMPGDYRFSVTVKSPDNGCDQYADWWEVITPDSTIAYRRILTHSHVNEQPFTRSGGPIVVDDSMDLIIRAHMNNLGYGCIVFTGNILDGFRIDTISNRFAHSLSEADPLPSGCAF